LLDVLANRTYRHLFLAQVIALIGTGLATVALGLLAYNLAGAQAGSVLGTALAIKMVAYVGVAPIVGAFADRLPRRAFLVTMDLVRAAVALSLPFVNQIWQIYILIFVLQSASAAFTPTFQATIPDVLPDEKDYTRALSLSRLAYDMENLISPMLAAALLTVISFHWLFGGTVIGFLASAALVVSVRLPQARTVAKRTGSIYAKTFRAMVIVNTVVYIQSKLGRSSTDVPLGLAAFGTGSMVMALLLPKLLENRPDRPAMMTGAAIMAVSLTAGVGVTQLGSPYEWPALLGLWFAMGLGYSMTLTPSGRLLKRSAHPQDRPAVFAAQFSLSHCCWLITYPLAGQLGARFGMTAAFAALATITAAGLAIACKVWPANDPDVIVHTHADTKDLDGHLAQGEPTAATTHSHPYMIDDYHPQWPSERG